MNVPFVDLNQQYKAIREEVNTAIQAVLSSSQFILGEQVHLFEKEFAAYCGTRYAIGVDTGTSALELALRALNIGEGDEVITPANTFIATALAILAVGAKPVLVDIHPHTYNLSISEVEGAITEKTKAILPVHLYGQPADMHPLQEIARYYGLAIIEDACQAHGAFYKGQRVGSLGDAAAFSFYPSKNLGCYGDGGIVVTNSAQVADNMRMLRNYGQRKKYEHLVMGYNRRLDSLQAAVLRVKLRHLDAWNAARRAHAARYGELLQDVDIVLPATMDGGKHVFHVYVIRSQQRDYLQAYLEKQGIGTVIHYPIPIHLQPACSQLGYRPGHFPITEQYAGEILSLPMYPELTEELIQTVSDSIHAFDAEAQLLEPLSL